MLQCVIEKLISWIRCMVWLYIAVITGSFDSSHDPFLQRQCNLQTACSINALIPYSGTCTYVCSHVIYKQLEIRRAEAANFHLLGHMRMSSRAVHLSVVFDSTDEEPMDWTGQWAVLLRGSLMAPVCQADGLTAGLTAGLTNGTAELFASMFRPLISGSTGGAISLCIMSFCWTTLSFWYASLLGVGRLMHLWSSPLHHTLNPDPIGSLLPHTLNLIL